MPSMPATMDIGHFRDWVRANRIRCGWSQAELASRLGVDVGTISRWERVTRSLGLPNLLDFRNLCALFVVSADVALQLRREPEVSARTRVARRRSSAATPSD